MAAAAGSERRGFLLAIGAYSIWGFILPLYMKGLSAVSPIEIVAHRILWAIPFAIALLAVQGSLRHALVHFRAPRTMAIAALTAALISVNWGIYVYAIVSDQALSAALGYYINPLVNVVLGVIFLQERPTRLQAGAIALAVIGVLILTFGAGGLPWIALVLAFSFGTYGLLRKIVPVGASEGFFLEVVILAIPSLLAIWLLPGPSHFLDSPGTAALLVIAGPLTAIPLILYAAGARLLHYATIGMLQYMVPTLLFLTAVFMFREPFGTSQLVAFLFIWSALGLYSFSLLRERRRARHLSVKPETV